jgi:phosphoribosylformylglycinamidine synthase
MTNAPKHLMHFEGGNALSAFRSQGLLARLAQINPRIAGISARFVHWVWSDAAQDRATQDKLAALLAYGESATAGEGALVVVMPRLGTVSPWASKATDIAHNCGAAIHRVERVTEFRLQAKAGLFGNKPLSPEELHAAALLLHDRMTESVAFERDAARHLFDERDAEPMAHVDVLAQGRRAAGRSMRRTPRSASRCRMTRSTTSSWPSANSNATRATSS